MLSFRNLSLRRKQMLIIMLTSTVPLLLACAAFVAYDVSRFRREMVESLSSLAEVVGNSTTAALDFNDPAAAAQTLAALRSEPNILRAHVHTPDGHTFSTYARAGAPVPPEVAHSASARHEFTARHLHLFRPIMEGNEQVGTIELVADLNELQERLWRYAGIAGLVLAVSLLVAFGLSNWLQRLISDPILSLAQMARAVAVDKNYSVRAAKKSNDELGQLVDGFNEMLAQIQQRDAALQTARNELEVRIIARTAELAQVNEALQTENTERKSAEETLQRQKTELRVLFDLMPALIWFKDTKNGILRVNQRVADAAGKPVAEIEGKSSLQIYPQDAARFYADDREVIQSGKPKLGYVEKVCGSNGQDMWVQTDKVPYHDHDGQVLGIIVMSQDITERMRVQSELETTHKQLVDASRRGGMAEIATNVLHNVGNVLNSVNVSTGLLVESVKKLKTSSLARVVVLLREHPQDLGDFITNDPKGKHLPDYLGQLSEHLLAEQAAMVGELDSLRRNVEHIKEIVAMQQSYATFGGVKEIISVVDLVEDSLRINEGALSRHSVEVVREFSNVPPLNVEKHKILQILVNLVRNAKHACDDSGRADKRLTMRVANGAGSIKISVRDNGVGISPENLTRIFGHGFTTRKGGHGFGLHSGALAAQDVGGSLTAQSAGLGQGAVFTLELPLSLQKEVQPI